MPCEVAVIVARCRMCRREAYLDINTGDRRTYCGPNHCRSQERLCQACGKDFWIGVDGAGTKYCSSECKIRGYRPDSATRHHCGWCGKLSPSPFRRRPQAVWPYICEACLYPVRHVIDRLKDHHVPSEWAKQLRDNPNCPLCGRDILLPGNGNAKRLSPALAVDHDHSCCPADSKSCGKCIRGFLCKTCNSGIGLLGDSAEILARAAGYLSRWNEWKAAASCN
jgi:hypothetical protein